MPNKVDWRVCENWVRPVKKAAGMGGGEVSVVWVRRGALEPS